MFTPTVHHAVELGSTNTTLAEMAAAGAGHGTVLIADHQTAGRGRMDRRWIAPPRSSLLCSVLVQPACDLADLHLVTVAMAVAARDAVAKIAGLAPEVKWPNDLLFRGAKFAGILAEAQPSPLGERPQVVVGVGINCTFEGPEEAGGTSILRATGTTVEPRDLLNALLDAFGPLIELLDTEDGRATLLERYTSVLSTIGRAVRVELASGAVLGRAIGVDSSGALLVDADGDVTAYRVGDVVHVRPVDQSAAQ